MLPIRSIIGKCRLTDLMSENDGGGCLVGSFKLRGVELRERERERDIIPERGRGGGEAIIAENSPSV